MVFFLTSLSTFYVYYILKSAKIIGFLANEKYDIKKYFKKITKEKNITFNLLELAFVILILIAFVTNEKMAGMCTVILYMVLCLKIIKEKQNFKFNLNNIRTFIISTLIFIVLNIVVLLDYKESMKMFLNYNPVFIYYTLLYVAMYFIWIIIGVAGFINNLFSKKSLKKIKKN